MWSRRRWSSSSFSRDGTRWAPHPFASLPSFAAGGLASLGLGATFALAGAASADASDPSAPQTAFGADVRVSSAALRDVSRDVADGPPRARRRALRLLSKITLYIDHHDAVLAVPEVRSALLEALRLGDAVDDQSRALVLGCLADLAKHPENRAATILRRETLEALADAATPRRWRSSPPILARRAVSDATRLIAELAADDATHETLVASGVVDALARAAGISRWFPAWATMSPVAKRVVAHRQLVRVEDDEDVDDDESDAWNVDGASVVSANGKKVTWRGDSGASTSPYATLDALDRDVARHACAAWFGLAASNAGRAAIVASGATRTVVWHARSRRDRVAHRFAVGAAARFAAAASAKSTTGSTTATLRTATLRAATRGLVSGDGQAACYATGAMRAACEDSNLRAKMARWGAVGDVVRLLANPGAGWATDAEAREARKNASVAGKDEKAAESAARRVIRARERTGGRECAMRALETFAESGDEALKRAILKAPGGITAVAEIAAGTRGGSEIDARLRRRAAALLTKLGL